ncbi:hypothetical protein [Streptomyces sp. AM 2-1-1]|uniref:helix-turn-helix transcriptional regulator n=1 Tax=Streptomyces sp. AM 2-1-1 TaxID=3028709 RepID=UPI0023B9C6A9|nr:hypothetical protein [Streptomyces sp. AM 2-1-1]WEH40784.1 hypothetical protein PZB77_15440 [Streptomyces sp. AM 2-1-1]
MVANPPADGETLAEIAARYGRAYNTLSAQWSRHPAWPDPIGKRGRAYVYDPAQVDAVVREHFVREDTTFEARRLYTTAEIAERTGISTGTIRADVSKGRWPAPDTTEGRANLWSGATINTALAGRRSYRKSPESS